MSHRGQNPVNDTVQIWNGTRWVSYPNLNFQSSVLSTASSLWVASDASVGLTLSGANRRSISPVYDGTGNPLISTKRIFAHRLGAAGGADPQVVDLPKIVSGVSPLLVTGPCTLLLVDILLGVSHSGGSTTIGTRYVVRWDVKASGTFPYSAREVNVLGNTVDANLVITAGTVPEGDANEGAPRLTLNYNGYTNEEQMRYMLEMNMHLMGIVE